MIPFDAIIFDFDGVLLESEFEGSAIIARLLTSFGYPHRVEDALKYFVGLSGRDFLAAVERQIGAEVPPEFGERMKQEGARALKDGIAAVAGSIDFVRSLPSELPKAVASSSSTTWIRTHLEHLDLADTFGEHIYSGNEHVERGKPAPDIYLHAAAQLGTDIRRSVIIEDSEVGATGALASGATVIGLAAGEHCLDGHADMLRAIGVKHVAHSFDEVALLLGLTQTSR